MAEVGTMTVSMRMTMMMDLPLAGVKEWVVQNNQTFYHKLIQLLQCYYSAVVPGRRQLLRRPPSPHLLAVAAPDPVAGFGRTSWPR